MQRSASALVSLQARLAEREQEVLSLNSVIQRQGRTLQQHEESAIDEALKRKDKLMAANQKRADKLDYENETLRTALKREEALRREFQEKHTKAVNQLNAATELHAAERAAAAAEKGLIDDDTLSLLEADAKASKEKATKYRNEIGDLKLRLAERDEELAALRTELDEARAKAEADAKASLKAQAMALSGGGGGEEEKLPSETYRALQSQRKELTQYVRTLEEQLHEQQRSHGLIARQRESAAHASMVERCAAVTKQLRISETKLARATGLLEPTWRELQQVQELCDRLQEQNANLSSELHSESKLRISAGRMALQAHSGLHAALESLGTLRTAISAVGNAPTQANTGGKLPTPQEAAALAAAQLEAVSSAASALADDLADCISRTNMLAPFASTPPSASRSPTYAPPSVQEQLHLIADEPPPPNAARASRPATPSDQPQQQQVLQQQQRRRQLQQLQQSEQSQQQSEQEQEQRQRQPAADTGSAAGGGAAAAKQFSRVTSTPEMMNIPPHEPPPHPKPVPKPLHATPTPSPSKALPRVQSAKSPTTSSASLRYNSSASSHHLHGSAPHYSPFPTAPFPNPYMQAAGVIAHPKAQKGGAPSPFTKQKKLQVKEGYVPRVEGDGHVPPPVPPPSPPQQTSQNTSPKPTRASSGHALGAAKGAKADTSATQVLSLEANERPRANSAARAATQQPPHKEVTASAQPQSQDSGVGGSVVFGELLEAPYSPIVYPAAGSVSEGRRGWAQPSSPQRRTATGTMLGHHPAAPKAAQGGEAAGDEPPTTSRGTFIAVSGQKPHPVRGDARRLGAALPGTHVKDNMKA